MDQSTKRKAEHGSDHADKRARTKKQWKVPRKNEHGAPQSRAIQPGDSGIWITCNKGREGKCIGEMRDLFTDYAERLFPSDDDDDNTRGDDGSAAGAAVTPDIESEIMAEVDGIRRPSSSSVQLFTPIKIDLQCVIFFRTLAPVDPVSLVKKICEDAMDERSRKRTRFAKRLSPTTLTGRASEEGLERVAKEVLAPHFHQEPFRKRKFAIRPTLRNHSVLTRDNIIRQVAAAVGPGHEVDLRNYELLIVVEVYQNICGMSVVDDSFERLKRFNISEIFDPTPKEEPKPTSEVTQPAAVPGTSSTSPDN